MAKVVRSNPIATKKSWDAVSVSDAFSNFLRVKKLDCADNTMRIYAEIGERSIVPQLTELTGNDMSKLTADDLRDVLEEYSQTHENGGTVFLYRHMRTFVNWFWNEYDIPEPNPMQKVKCKKVSQPPKEGITQEEVDRLLEATKRSSMFPERDIAFIMLLCDTGIRKSSIINLRMRDVNVDRSEIVCFEKDQQFHTKPFGAATCKAIKKYLNCLEGYEPDDPFWLSVDGKHLAPSGFREILRRNCTAAGIPVHQFHDFRRYYGLQLYNSTHDIYAVSRALDHKSIEVTKRYLAIDDRENAEVVRAFSPMDKKFRQTKIRVQR